MSSALRLTGTNIYTKFYENPSTVKEIWSGHEIQGSNSWPSIVNVTLSRHGWVTGSAHCPTEPNIYTKFYENPSRAKGDMKRTRNSRLKHVTFVNLTFSRHGWVTGSALHLTEANIQPMFNENPSRGKGDMERTQKCYGRTRDVSKFFPLRADLFSEAARSNPTEFSPMKVFPFPL